MSADVIGGLTYVALAYDLSGWFAEGYPGSSVDGMIVAAEIVEVSGSVSSEVKECNLPTVLLHGIGESTSVVACLGVKCTTAGSGGSVINDVGVGSS